MQTEEEVLRNGWKENWYFDGNFWNQSPFGWSNGGMIMQNKRNMWLEMGSCCAYLQFEFVWQPGLWVSLLRGFWEEHTCTLYFEMLIEYNFMYHSDKKTSTSIFWKPLWWLWMVQGACELDVWFELDWMWLNKDYRAAMAILLWLV